MISELKQKQIQFSVLLGNFLQHASKIGYVISGGEWWRPPEMAAIYAKQGKGIRNSAHGNRIAIDINLWIPIRNDKFELIDLKPAAAKDYAVLADWWKARGGSWGGDFRESDGRPKPDIYHYSIEHNGVK